MNNKKHIILPIVSVVVLAALIIIGFRTSAPEEAVISTTEEAINLPWPSAEVEKISTNEKTQNYNITASYPKTNSDSISKYFKSYIEDQVTSFKEDTSWVNDVESASSQILTLDIDYEAVNSNNVQNYIFSTNSYTGGAHGLQVRKTFSFDKGGQLLNISNLFSNGLDGLNTLATLVQKELLKRDGADAKWIADGAGAREDNYSSFVVTDTGVKILFDPYQVASYADGNIDITIPFMAFSKIANPEIFSN
jgi:hypothetical protein